MNKVEKLIKTDRNNDFPARIDGHIALETLGRILLYSPMIGLLFTSLWSVGLSLLTVVMPLTWLTFGGSVPDWMRAAPEKRPGHSTDTAGLTGRLTASSQPS